MKNSFKWIALAVFLVFIVSWAFKSEAHASVSAASRVDKDYNDVSPFIVDNQPMRFFGGIIITDECYTGNPPPDEYAAVSWIIVDNEFGNLITSGDGDFLLDDYPKTLPIGTYDPYIYFFDFPGATVDDIPFACTTSQVFSPFEIIEEPIDPEDGLVDLSTDPIQNVLLAALLMLYTAEYVRRVFFS